MGRMNDFNLWLVETGRAEHHPLTDELVMLGDNNISDPSLWEAYLEDSADPDKGVWHDDEDEDDLCDMSASHPGVYYDDDAEDEWFEDNGGLTADAWNFLAEQDRTGKFV